MVLEQWRRDRERAHQEAFFAALLEKYRVVTDEPIRPLVTPLLTPRELSE